MKHIFLILLTILVLATYVYSQNFEAFQRATFTSAQGEMEYRILFPEGYSADRKYPLILFLHGAGERGSDNEKQLTHGANFFLKHRSSHPAIVVFPQCKQDGYWIDISIRPKLFAKEKIEFEGALMPPLTEMQQLRGLLDYLLANHAIDSRRVYVMGLSMGGMGTLELLGRWPETFSAAIAICGAGNITAAEKYASQVSVWLTHGDKDDIVDVNYSRQLYQKLQDLNADIIYTEFAETNHNAWDPTFEIPGLLDWLFNKSKPN